MKRANIMFFLAAALTVLTACHRQEYYAESSPVELVMAVETMESVMPATEATTVMTEVATAPGIPPAPDSDEAFVRILDYIPGAYQELRYATENNFTGKQIYSFCEAYLRYGTVEKLMLVAEELEQQGLYLKIWDGFRPVSAQFTLWEICPDPTYVANPEKGYSSHSRGNTVDLTLVDKNGQELEMPTGFDDFSAKANRDYSDCTETAAANARLLEMTMEKYGFSGYYGEWWHFSDTQSYPVEEEFQPNAG